MESKKMNVTEPWFQVITQLTLSYRRNRNEVIKVENHAVKIADAVDVISTSIIKDEIKPKNQIF